VLVKFFVWKSLLFRGTPWGLPGTFGPTGVISPDRRRMTLVLIISLLPVSSAWAPLDVEVDPSALLPGPAVSPT
jgi:hypothetical protein